MADKTFEEWMKEVDQELNKFCGMPSNFLEDYCYYSCFESGDTPKEAAEGALEYNCTSMGFSFDELFGGQCG